MSSTRHLFLRLLTLSTAALAASSVQAQQTVYAIGAGGASLIRFQSNNPANVTVVGQFNGAATFLDAIDFRPLNGQLYGYLDSADAFYTVDLATAQLTLVSTPAPGAVPTNTFQVGLDFNPSIDRARLITDSDQNIVFNPITGTVTGATNLFYGTGDANELADPNIIDNAYSNNNAGTAITQQYGIDYELNSLVTIANNAGTLATVGPLGVDTTIYTGFDIYTHNGVNSAYAVLTGPAANAVPGFYTINLQTGAATLVGSLGVTDQVYSLAVIPAPSGLGLLAVSGVLAIRRRR